MIRRMPRDRRFAQASAFAFRLWLVLCGACFASIELGAQSIQATLTGTVRDAGGADYGFREAVSSGLYPGPRNPQEPR